MNLVELEITGGSHLSKLLFKLVKIFLSSLSLSNLLVFYLDHFQAGKQEKGYAYEGGDYCESEHLIAEGAWRLIDMGFKYLLYLCEGNC